MMLRQLIHWEAEFLSTCQGRCRYVEATVLQSFDHLLKEVGRLGEKRLTGREKAFPGEDAQALSCI